MKLYSLDEGDYFKLAGDPDSPVFRFYKIDGMYGICYTKKGEILHFVGTAPVIRVEGGFDGGR